MDQILHMHTIVMNGSIPATPAVLGSQGARQSWRLNQDLPSLTQATPSSGMTGS